MTERDIDEISDMLHGMSDMLYDARIEIDEALYRLSQMRKLVAPQDEQVTQPVQSPSA